MYYSHEKQKIHSNQILTILLLFQTSMPNINKTALFNKKHTFSEHGATIRKNKKKCPKTRVNKNIAILISLAYSFDYYIRQ